MKKILFLCGFFMTVEINADDIKIVCSEPQHDRLESFVINTVEKNVLAKEQKKSLDKKINPNALTTSSIEKYHDVLSWEYPIVITKREVELHRYVYVFDLEKGVVSELFYYNPDDRLPGYSAYIWNCLGV